jgi:hypothetical protein
MKVVRIQDNQKTALRLEAIKRAAVGRRQKQAIQNTHALQESRLDAALGQDGQK